ncbi:MAG TPA: hypothetical protein VK435_11960, partial [Thermodesulfovibrionales bacterium]|nr:hypothetical protein [Thermodesulfovibrionales bacterium]
MKRLGFLLTIMMSIVWCLAGASWANEASVFDNTQKIIIRAYTVCTGNCSTAPAYSAYLDIRD